MSFPVVLDACVLIPMPIADLLLRLATAKQFRPLWSDEILNEVERNLVKKLHKDPHSARTRVNAMRDFFPDALVENYESLVPAMTNDPKGRHVLAAAVRSRAELIVTSNQKDFPTTALKPYDVAVRSPDDFLLDQLDLDPSTVVRIAKEVVADMRNPTITWNGYLEGLARAGLPRICYGTRKADRRSRLEASSKGHPTMRTPHPHRPGRRYAGAHPSSPLPMKPSNRSRYGAMSSPSPASHSSDGPGTPRNGSDRRAARSGGSCHGWPPGP